LLKNLHQTPKEAMNHPQHKLEPRFSDPSFWLLQDFPAPLPSSDQNASRVWCEAGGGEDTKTINNSQGSMGSPREEVDLPAHSSDTADAKTEANGGHHYNNSNNSKRSHNRCVASKNLVSERKRRAKLNEGLFQLRSQVPKISKVRKQPQLGPSF